MQNQELKERIAAKLAEFNKQIIEKKLYVRSFYLEYDEDFEGYTANLVYIVLGESSIISLDDITKYCNQAYDHLEEEVEFTYCLYRTEEEYKEGFTDAYWTNTLTEVSTSNIETDAILQPA